MEMTGERQEQDSGGKPSGERTPGNCSGEVQDSAQGFEGGDTMNFGHQLPGLFDGNCGCCQVEEVLRDSTSEAYGCKERTTVLTYREERVLKKIREFGLKARDLKARLKGMGSDSPVDPQIKQELLRELEDLRKVRADLEVERIAAADERMRLLGHL
jgi:hypothetical protein